VKIHTWTQTELATWTAGTTLNSFLREWEANWAQEAHFLCRIWINNCLVDAETEEDLSDVSVAALGSLKVQTLSQTELISQTLQSLLDAIEDVHRKIAQHKQQATDKNPEEGWTTLDRILENLQEMNEALTHLKPILLTQSLDAASLDEAWQQAESQISDVLRELFEAFAQKTNVKDVSLIDHKLSSSLSTWQQILQGCRDQINLNHEVA
jgi:hypothetical protein